MPHWRAALRALLSNKPHSRGYAAALSSAWTTAVLALARALSRQRWSGFPSARRRAASALVARWLGQHPQSSQSLSRLRQGSPTRPLWLVRLAGVHFAELPHFEHSFCERWRLLVVNFRHLRNLTVAGLRPLLDEFGNCRTFCLRRQVAAVVVRRPHEFPRAYLSPPFPPLNTGAAAECQVCSCRMA